jgi:hypothetical protein
MRKFLHAGIVVVSALVVVLPMAAADAATGHVLTIRSTHGPAVRPGAVLSAGLVKGTTAVFALGSEKLSCKVATFAATVTSNPSRPGAAKETVKSQRFSKCTVNVQGVTVKSLKVLNLPYKVAVSDAKGHPVTVVGHAKAKPIKTSVTVALGTLSVTCTYKTSKVNGHQSNTGNKITFVKQKFTKVAGGSLCPPSANFTATFGPVRDLSVLHAPKVFVH